MLDVIAKAAVMGGIGFLAGYFIWTVIRNARRDKELPKAADPVVLPSKPAAASGPVPGWAEPMTAEEFARFLDLVGDYFRQAEMPLEVNVGEGIQHPDPGGGGDAPRRPGPDQPKALLV